MDNLSSPTKTARLAARLTPELTLVCSAIFAETEATTIHDLLEAPLDWPAVIAGAREHRVFPQVFAGLQRHGNRVPSWVLDTLQRQCRNDVIRCMAQVAEVARLARLFEAAGVRLLLLKGVAVSQQVHGDPLARSPGDIDLLVSPADYWTAGEILRDAGYTLDTAVIPADYRASAGHQIRELPYRRPGHLVELHQRVADNPNCLPLDFDTLWRDRDRLNLGGVEVATLPREFLALYLCVHGSRHCWERLRWLVDMVFLFQSPEEREQALEHAETVGLGRPMRQAAVLLNILFATPIEPLPVTGADRREAARLIGRFFAGNRWRNRTSSGRLAALRRQAWIRFQIYTLKGTWRHAAQELAAEWSSPADWSLFRLPKQLLWLYPVLRPVGWMARRATAGLGPRQARDAENAAPSERR